MDSKKAAPPPAPPGPKKEAKMQQSKLPVVTKPLRSKSSPRARQQAAGASLVSGDRHPDGGVCV